MSTQQLKAVATGNGKPTTFPSMLTAYKQEIARALPRHLNPENMLRIALTAFRMNPKLEECEPASVFACVVQASQLGLRPNMLGECFLIPYKDYKSGKMICQLQLGYQGLLDLVRRSGMVESIGAYLVNEKDTYEVRFGTDPGITHEPFLEGDPGPVKFGYAVAKLKGGGTHVEVMTVEDINAIRDRSQNVKSAKKYNKETPWDTDWEEMARKTLARRICKWLPKSNELATALSLQNAADAGAQNVGIQDAIDNTFVAPAPALEHEDAGGDYVPQFDATTAVAYLRGAKELKTLDARMEEIETDFERSKRDLPVDVEAAFNDLRDSLE